MFDVRQVTDLHRRMVDRWHHQEIDNSHEGLLRVVCTQHSFNFLLWHEEDIARSPNVGDSRIAEVKRNIDGYNQRRNNWIEKIDDWISAELLERRVSAPAESPLNTETPGSVIDRLSILSLRIYHMQEQVERTDATPEHLTAVRGKLAICLEQLDDLSGSLATLIDDIVAGRRRHKTYRALKMYNDPALNPYLYRGEQRLAS